MENLAIHFATGLLICKQCKIALIPSRIDSHYKQKIHNLPKSIRTEIARDISDSYDLVNNINDVNQIIQDFVRNFDGNYLELLSLFRDGILCQQCPYICRSRQGIQNHCRTEHSWENPRLQGYHKKINENDPWDSNILCQQFFPRGHGSRFFRVQHNPRENVESIRFSENNLEAYSRESLDEREPGILNNAG